MSIQRMNVAELAAPVGPYVHAVTHHNTLYTSGLTAFGTGAQSGSISEQACEIFKQLTLIAQVHETSLDNIVKVQVFVTDLSDMAALRETLFDLYGAHLPASSLIKIEELFAPELSIEVEAIFAL